MGSVGNSQVTSGPEKVVDFGNGSYMEETVSYAGVQMTRKRSSSHR